MSYPYRDGLINKEWATNGELAAERALSVIDEQIGAANLAAIIIEPGAGRGRIHRSCTGIPARTAGLVHRQRRGVHRRRGPERIRPDRPDVRLRGRGHRLGPDRDRRKGIADGLPLSAVTGRADIMDAPTSAVWARHLRRQSVALRAALGTIETLEMDGMLDRAKQIERLMKDKLHRMQADDDRIGDVRGRGAMIVVELVKSGTRRTGSGTDQGAVRQGARPGRHRSQLRHLRQHPALLPLA